ncbi:MAG TPA: hypothetical protein VFE46_19405 [Pirellulales bacterium]|jgi:hypothetical protein|nr:hypothetical protein [Pirellulales bacterium]
MSTLKIAAVSAALTLCGMWNAVPAGAQQTNVGVGQHNLNDGFFESMGVGFGASGKNWFFNNGGFAPQLGGMNPGGGASLGFGFGGGGINGFMNIGAAQGSMRGMSSAAGSLTVPNGGSGFIGDLTQQPFVTGVIPVVGNFADDGALPDGNFGQRSIHAPTVLDERLARLQELGGYKPGGGFSLNANSGGQESASHIDWMPGRSGLTVADPTTAKLAQAQRSSAGQSTASIAAIQQQQAVEDESAAREVRSLLKQGHEAQAAGKNSVARIYYRQAAKSATGDLKAEVEQALRSLGDSPGNR